MTDPFKICWCTPVGMQPIANAYGYWTHNKMLRQYTEKIAKLDVNAPDALTITPPEQFIPIPEKTNWLFTMFEGMDIPDIYADHLGMADYLIVPSQWVKELFQPHFKGKIFVVSHGVSPFYTFKKRKLPLHKPFRFLWVGAPNPRKGYEELIASWIDGGFFQEKNIELYIKTTGAKVPIEKRANITLDSRKLSNLKLLKLYHDAHCFLFPTRGEGFGLTLAEAMRTGLPCIAACHTGTKDFFGEGFGYPLKHRIDESKIKLVSRQDIDWMPTRTYFPDFEQMTQQMIHVMTNYQEALDLGRKAHEHIRDHFTWDRAAQTLVNVMQTERSQEGVGLAA